MSTKMSHLVWLDARVIYSRLGTLHSKSVDGIMVLGQEKGSPTDFTLDQLASIQYQLGVKDGKPVSSFFVSYGKLPGMSQSQFDYDLASFLGITEQSLFSYHFHITIDAGGRGPLPTTLEY